ncbi:nuclear envelope integral membrane protein-like [Amblyomma americanum]|uniref:Uncharacterized protein n=1 Tax=Amblyomma americanum TaxID=6943 RepID=A0AAQ4FFY3_AMBAM
MCPARAAFTVTVLFSALGGAVGSSVLLQEHSVYSSPKKPEYVDTIDVYCWEPPHDVDIFRAASIVFSVVPGDLSVFTGVDAQEVQQQHVDSILRSPFLTSKSLREVSLNRRDARCVGVASREAYEFVFQRDVSRRRLVQFCLGVAVFFLAPAACRNAAVFYACGTGLGVLAFLLIAVFLASRLLPRRAAGYAVLAFGWTVVLSWLDSLWSNAHDVLANYLHLVVGYAVASALVSFAVCYRFGPPSNPRTLDLIQWSLQLAAAACVYFSSDRRDVTAAVVVLMLTLYLLPKLCSKRRSASRGAPAADLPRTSSCSWCSDDGTWTIMTKVRAPQAKKISMYIHADDPQNGGRPSGQWLTVTESGMCDDSSEEPASFRSDQLDDSESIE